MLSKFAKSSLVNRSNYRDSPVGRALGRTRAEAERVLPSSPAAHRVPKNVSGLIRMGARNVGDLGREVSRTVRAKYNDTSRYKAKAKSWRAKGAIARKERDKARLVRHSSQMQEAMRPNLRKGNSSPHAGMWARIKEDAAKPQSVRDAELARNKGTKSVVPLPKGEHMWDNTRLDARGIRHRKQGRPDSTGPVPSRGQQWLSRKVLGLFNKPLYPVGKNIPALPKVPKSRPAPPTREKGRERITQMVKGHRK